jgi:hypothetical protein
MREVSFEDSLYDEKISPRNRKKKVDFQMVYSSADCAEMLAQHLSEGHTKEHALTL